MKNTLVFIIGTLLATALYAANNEKNDVSFTADIKGLGNDAMYVRYFTWGIVGTAEWGEGAIKYDTIVADDGKFQFKYQTSEIQYALLFNNPDRWHFRHAYLILEPGKPLDITGKIENTGYISYQVKQHYTVSADFANHRELYKAIEIQMDSLELWTERLLNKGIIKHNDSTHRWYGNEYNRLQREIINLKASYIKNNPNKDLSAVYLVAP